MNTTRLEGLLRRINAIRGPDHAITIAQLRDRFAQHTGKTYDEIKATIFQTLTAGFGRKKPHAGFRDDGRLKGT